MTRAHARAHTPLGPQFISSKPIQPVDPRWLDVRTIKGLKSHDVIYGVAAGMDGRIYLGVSNEHIPGLHAQLWSYDPRDHRFRRHVDVAAFAKDPPGVHRVPHCRIHLCLEVDSNGIVYAMTHFTVPSLGEEFFLPIETWADANRGFEGARLFSYDPARDCVGDHGVVMPYEGAATFTGAWKANDGQFWFFFCNTVFLMLGIPVGMALSLMLALFMNQKLRGVTIFQTIFFLPHFTAGIAIILL